MEINHSLERIYTHPIFSSLLKNDVTLYGPFIREVLYENVDIDDFHTYSFKPINCFSLLSYKKIIERDLNEFIISITPITMPSIIDNTRCHFITYNLEYKNISYTIDFSYIKTNLSYHLSYYISELNLITDIDSLYLNRTTTGLLDITSIYPTNPIPLYKLINNIKYRKFKIISKTILLFNSMLYKYIKYLVNSGWKNIENKLIRYLDIDKRERLQDNCGICGETHNIKSVELPCSHLYHNSCLMEYVDMYVKNKEYKDKDLTCPYCTKKINIVDIL